MPQINLNGKPKEVEESLTLTGLLEDLQLDHRRVAAVVNDDIVNRDDFDTTHLTEGDSVELVTLVGGG